jgi:hypothetical protein
LFVHCLETECVTGLSLSAAAPRSGELLKKRGARWDFAAVCQRCFLIFLAGAVDLVDGVDGVDLVGGVDMAVVAGRFARGVFFVKKVLASGGAICSLPPPFNKTNQ